MTKETYHLTMKLITDLMFLIMSPDHAKLFLESLSDTLSQFHNSDLHPRRSGRT